MRGSQHRGHTGLAAGTRTVSPEGGSGVTPPAHNLVLCADVDDTTYLKGASDVDVKEFDKLVREWAVKWVDDLASCDSANHRRIWTVAAKEEFRTVARCTGVPLDVSRFDSTDLTTEGLHLQWLIEAHGASNAVHALLAWAMNSFVPGKMLLTDAEDNPAMQQAAKEQYGMYELEFEHLAELWAECRIAELLQVDTVRGREIWAARAKESFCTVAGVARVPIAESRFQVNSLFTESARVRAFAIEHGASPAAEELVTLVVSLFLPWQMAMLRQEGSATPVRKAQYRAAMQLASEKQYPPVQPPVQEVMRLCFPEIEDGCALYLYATESAGVVGYRMTNGDCWGELEKNVAAYECDEWAVSIFRLMEAFYRMCMEVPS